MRLSIGGLRGAGLASVCGLGGLGRLGALWLLCAGRVGWGVRASCVTCEAVDYHLLEGGGKANLQNASRGPRTGLKTRTLPCQTASVAHPCVKHPSRIAGLTKYWPSGLNLQTWASGKSHWETCTAKGMA